DRRPGSADRAAARLLRGAPVAQSAPALFRFRAPRRRRARHAPLRGLLPARPQLGEPRGPGTRPPYAPRGGPPPKPSHHGDHTMEMTGEQQIPVSRHKTWQALNDLEVLKACIPGCESIEPSGENQYDVVLTARVGPVSAR